MMSEKMLEKLGTVSKRREILRVEFEKGLKAKEDHFQ